MLKGVTGYEESLTDADGEKHPDEKITESMFMRSAILMSKYKGTTRGGMSVDETWQANDGLVNEISAKAPNHAPFKEYSKNEEIVPGTYYVMPTVRGDHMYFQGGLNLYNFHFDSKLFKCFDAI